jgi:hypothetical protein
MRWDDERFVKVYTRDTPDWLSLGWEAHALFWELLRKSDRAGLFDSGKSGPRGVAAVTGIPVDVVERALPILIADGCIEKHGTYFLVRNFIEAQSANQSDKARAQKSRETARDSARRNTAITSHSVTGIGDESRNVVTECDSNRENVTPRVEGTRAEVSRTEDTGISPRDPSATSTEHLAPILHDAGLAVSAAKRDMEPKLPGGYEWLCRFQIAHRAKFSRDYGHGEQDARATGKLSELLESMPAEERSSDWERRRELFDEFLGRTDARTQAAGWSFAFFVQDFRALAIPVAKRPKPQEKPNFGQRQGPPPKRWAPLPGAE